MMTNDRIEEAKKGLLHGIELLASIADHQEDKHIMHGLQAQAALLENLGARIDLHLLPEKFVKSAMQDVRRDTFTLLTGLKASLILQIQQLGPSADHLGGTAHKAIAPFEVQRTTSRVEVDAAQRTAQIASDLQALKGAEDSLRSCLQ
jgi:hypothetical protein